MGDQAMLKLQTPKGNIAVMEGERLDHDLSRLGGWINRPAGTVHYKHNVGQTFCLCCKSRAEFWVDTKSALRRHPDRCQPIGHWPKGE